MPPRKTHIRIPSVEGQLGYPPDLLEQYKKANGNGNGNGKPDQAGSPEAAAVEASVRPGGRDGESDADEPD